MSDQLTNMTRLSQEKVGDMKWLNEESGVETLTAHTARIATYFIN